MIFTIELCKKLQFIKMSTHKFETPILLKFVDINIDMSIDTIVNLSHSSPYPR